MIKYQIPEVVFPHREVPQPVVTCDCCGYGEWLFPGYGQKIGDSKKKWGMQATKKGVVQTCSDECRKLG